MEKNIFVYGTLMLPEIVFALTKKNFVMKDATLKGYKRFKVNDPNRKQKGPIIIEQKNSGVIGKILLDVDEDSIKILDKFESPSYEKRKVFVNAGAEKIEAIVYVGSNFNKEFLYDAWNEEEFKQKYLEFYLKKRIPKILNQISC